MFTEGNVLPTDMEQYFSLIDSNRITGRIGFDQNSRTAIVTSGTEQPKGQFTELQSAVAYFALATGLAVDVFAYLFFKGGSSYGCDRHAMHAEHTRCDGLANSPAAAHCSCTLLLLHFGLLGFFG